MFPKQIAPLMFGKATFQKTFYRLWRIVPGDLELF